jgi:hypothetical protein
MSQLDPEAAGEDAGELARRIANVDGDLELLGLYVTRKSITVQMRDPDAAPTAFISTLIGRVAFNDRVQQHLDANDSEFENLVADHIDHEFDERRRQLRSGDAGPEDPEG